MGYKLNVFTGTLDIAGKSTGSGSGVTRIGSTTDRSIPLWAGNNSDTIQGSKATIQDGGAILAQGFITRRIVDDVVTVPSGYSWITPEIELSDTGSIEIEDDTELIVN